MHFLNIPLVRDYIKTSSLSLVAKILLISSGFITVFLLNVALDKEVFGLFMMAFTLCVLLSGTIARFFQGILMYHVSRNYEARTLLPTCLLWCGAITLTAALGLYVSSNFIADMAGKPALSSLLKSFALFVPAYGLNAVLTTYYRAAHRVNTMLIYQEIVPSVIKIIGIAVLAFAFPSITAFIAVFIISSLIPLLILGAQSMPIILQKMATFTPHDCRYGGLIVLNHVFNKSSRNFLVVLVGFIGSAALVADLTIALKLSEVLMIPKSILSQFHVPRIGKRLANNKITELLKEFKAVQLTSLYLTGLGCIITLFIGPYILGLFGAYTHIFPLLLLLCIVSVIRAGFGDVDTFVTIAGYPGRTLILNILGFVALVLVLLLNTGAIDQNILGLSLLVNAITTLSGYTMLIYKKQHLMILNTHVVFVIASLTALLSFAILYFR
jgi:O-antigen/teichoic acid export membrane protein